MVAKPPPKDAGGNCPHGGRGRHRGAFPAGDRLAARGVEEDQSQEDLRSPGARAAQRETSLTRGIIRDLFSAKVDALHVDSRELYNEIEQYLGQIDPDLMSRVHLYAEASAAVDKFDIESEIRDLFKARVELPTGGSLIVQPTEALISIDVNTGRYTGKKDPEKTILRTNLEAAERSRARSASGTSVGSSSATSSTWRPGPTGTRCCRSSGPISAGIARAPRRWRCRSSVWWK